MAYKSNSNTRAASARTHSLRSNQYEPFACRLNQGKVNEMIPNVNARVTAMATPHNHHSRPSTRRTSVLIISGSLLLTGSSGCWVMLPTTLLQFHDVWQCRKPGSSRTRYRQPDRRPRIADVLNTIPAFLLGRIEAPIGIVEQRFNISVCMIGRNCDSHAHRNVARVSGRHDRLAADGCA